MVDTKAMEEQLRPLAYKGGKCAPRAMMMGLKMMEAEVFNELETALSSCADGLGKVIAACNNSRVVLQRHENVTTASLQELDNVLISDRQHCVFKHDGLIIDPDDASAMPFEEFAEAHDAGTPFVAATAVIFETKEEALKWKQAKKKKKRQRHEEQLRERKRACS